MKFIDLFFCETNVSIEIFMLEYRGEVRTLMNSSSAPILLREGK